MKVKQIWNRFTNFVKENKEIIALFGIVAVSTAGGVYLNNWLNNAEKLVSSVSETDLPIPSGFSSGDIAEIWSETLAGNSITNMIVNDVPLWDLGEFGKQLTENFKDIGKDPSISMVLGIVSDKS